MEVVKTWAMKGLTPADQEYKNVFEKEEERVLAAPPAAAPDAAEKKSSWWGWGK